MDEPSESSENLNSNYTSDELFHFVGHSSPLDDDSNYQTLSNVLRERCISHPPHDLSGIEIKYTVDWRQRLETETLIIPDVTCFADIPIDALSIHTSKYGKFGLGLTKSLLIRYGTRPVMYFPTRHDDCLGATGTSMLREIESVIRGFNEFYVEPQESAEEWTRIMGEIPRSPDDVVSALESILLREFLAFIKPYNSELTDGDPNNYYMEREWRKLGNMPFKLEQVTSVAVARNYQVRMESDFPQLKGRIVEI